MSDSKVNDYSVKRERSGRKELGERFDFSECVVLRRCGTYLLSYRGRGGKPQYHVSFIWVCCFPGRENSGFLGRMCSRSSVSLRWEEVGRYGNEGESVRRWSSGKQGPLWALDKATGSLKPFRA